MINLTDLHECEVLLPGNWRRPDTGDTYSFTTDKMTIRDEVLYRQLVVLDRELRRHEYTYALSIIDDYCALLINDEPFIITAISRTVGSDGLKLENTEGLSISFEPA